MKLRLKLLPLLFAPLLLLAQEKKNPSLINFPEWKFKKGDDLNYKKPAYNDVDWSTVKVGVHLTKQGYTNNQGIQWYRIHFFLPEEFRNASYYKDYIQILIGRINDTEETYLNGVRIGINGRNAPDADTSIHFEKEIVLDKNRIYFLSTKNKNIRWGKENVIAVRVLDNTGGGGIFSSDLSISMRDVKDYIDINFKSKSLEKVDGVYKGNIVLKNTSTFTDFSGTVEVKIIDRETNKVLKTEHTPVVLKKENVAIAYSIPDLIHRYALEVNYLDSKSKKIVTASSLLPYILTPSPSASPKINGAKIVGASPKKPFLYRIPTSGDKPITFEVQNLPKGLVLNAATGIIAGVVEEPGLYEVNIIAKNNKGEAQRKLQISIGDKLCLTPPMGWNSWNCWGLNVDAEKVKTSADAFIAKGLADHGWAYVNIDDGWEAETRQPDGSILPNQKFGDMKNLSDYLHERGLKLGIYSSPGTVTCGKFLGSYEHEMIDAQSYAKWGADYLKYDWCSYFYVLRDHKEIKLEDYIFPYKKMGDFVKSQDRDIVFSLCQAGMSDVWKWGNDVNGTCWRTTYDIQDTWKSMSEIGFNQDHAAPYAKPGNWNDEDMLVVGWVGWGNSLHITNLTPDEQYTHISLWSLLASPLLIGCDMGRLDDFTISLLTNDEVIEINQDVMGKQATAVQTGDGYKVYVKELEDGSKAVGLFNLSEETKTITADWKTLAISGEKTVRDVWRQKDIGKFNNAFSSTIPPHGSVLIKVLK